MPRILSLIILCIFFSLFQFLPIPNSFSQCPYDNAYYTTVITSCPGSTTAACVFGGEYVTLSVIAGNTYTFSTCGIAGFDTQLTLYQSGGGGSLAYSDDACGLQSSITWTATFTGTVDILLDEYNCLSNLTCQPIDIQCSSGGGGPITASDCNQAVNVCTDLNFSIDPNGFGAIDEIPAPGSFSNPNVNPTSGNSGCLLSGEKNSTWMLVYISGTGNLEFTFGGNGTQSGYYDWIMYQWSSTICSDIPNNLVAPVRCNWNCTSSGGTGLASTLPAGGSACNFESPLPVTCGQQYVIVFSNWSSVTTSVPLQFGGTATVSCTPSTLNITVTPASPVICAGGSVTLTASGATTYTWSPATGLNSTIGSSVVASPSSTTTYTVTGVTGCVQGTAMVTVTVSPTFTMSTSQVNPTCVGSCNGQATVTPAGGTAPFTYSWSGGGTNQTKTGLCAGTYTATVTDATGCMNTATVTITDPPVLSVSVSPTNVTCSDLCNGTLTASGNGGTSPYTYNWSGGLGSGSPKTGVCAGNYTVTITDSKGCTATGTGTITQPAALTVTVTPVNETCDGGCNGSVTTSASGGVSTYTYNWCCALGSGASKTFLCDGTYTVTITDANGCTATGSGIVNPGPVIAAGFTYNGNQCLSSNSFSFTNTGTMGVSYSWSFPSGSPSTSSAENPSGITWSAAGTYTITQTVTSGSCMNTATLNITVYPQPAVTISKNDISCNGQCNGSVTANVSSGTAPFTYNWNSGCMGSTCGSLCMGTYTVTVTDVYGCSATASATLTEPPALSVSITPANESCDGSCDGSATAATSGGTSPYIYSWSGGLGTGTSKTGLCDGNYTVTVTDSKGCTATNTGSVNPGPVISSGFTYNGNQCLAGNSYNFSNTGTMGVTYSWTFPSGTPASSTSENPSGITWASAGTYTVTQTVSSGSCMSTSTLNITVYVQPSVAISKNDITCSGLCNGSVTANVTSGTSPFNFNWTNGCTMGTCGTLCAGTYTVTLTDAYGCTATASATITEPSLLTAIMSSTNASCNNVCNAMGTATVSGGIPPFTYQWGASTGFQSASTATGLCDGTHGITVTDSKGCTATGSVSPTEPAAITVNVSSTNSTCGSSTGSVTATPGGGTSPYTYNWSNGCMGSNCTNLPAGNYTITVTDASGCTQTANASVNDAGGISASLAIDQNITCFGLCNGQSTATVVGGTSPYTYVWSTGQTVTTTGTSQTRTGLCGGNVGVTITDASGCASSGAGVVTEPAVLAAAGSVTPESCNGSCNGSMSISVSGGLNPYTYAWPDGPTGPVPTKNGLCAGTLTVTVTDAYGCTTTVTGTITGGGSMILSATGTNATCNNLCNGSANLTVTGGAAPLTYNWSNSYSGEDPSGLCDGSITVTVTDASGCTATESVTITEPAALSITATPVNETCDGLCDGSATASASGGTLSYTYSWSGGLGTGTAKTGLCDGTYSVTVTDGNGCTASATATIIAGPIITSGFTYNGNQCLTGNSFNFTNTGTMGVSYSWTFTGGTPGSSTSENPSGITWTSAGTFNVTQTVSSGICSATTTLTVTVYPQPSVTLNATDVYCNNACNGSASLTVNGGTSPYTYAWNSGCVNSSCTSLCAGSYSVTVTDSKGCTATGNITITEPAALAVSASSTPATCGQTNGTATAAASGGNGVYSYTWSTSPVQNSQTANGLQGGVYTVTVTDNKGCTGTASATVNSSAGGSVNASISSPVTCYGLCNGSVSASMTGGTPSYTYQWSTTPVQNGSTATGLCAGTYTVTITDGNGCIGTSSITLAQPTAVSINVVSYSDLNCYNQCTGDITVGASGGTGVFSYQWNPVVSLGNSATGLCAGSYGITATDGNGCTAALTQTITQPSQLTVTVIGTTASCTGVCDGTATANAGGGIASYTYAWSDGQTSSTATALCGGSNVSVTVTDIKGCTASANYIITVLPDMVITISTSDATCAQANGSAWVTTTNGTQPYIAVWSNGCANDTCTGLLAGNYSVTVTDSKGCSATGTATVSNSSGPTAFIQNIVNTSCNGTCDGSASVLVTDGQPPYSFFWNTSPIQTTTAATGLCAGTWVVQVTDANACVTSVSVAIIEPPLLTVVISGITNITCNGQCNGTLSLTVSGGTSPYSFLWSNGTTTSSAYGLCSGSFSVTVTDANSCTATASATITEPPPLITLITTDSTSCNSTCSGGSSAFVSGGTTPYTYQWSSGQQTPVINNVCAGSYVLSVTDANGCMVIASASVMQPATLTILIGSSGNVDCSGNSNGWAQSIAGGGTSPYTYNWSNGQQASQAINLAGGDYTVTVSDYYGCTGTASVVITEPQPLFLIISKTDASCFSLCDGTASADITGGVLPYSFLWDGNAYFQATQTADSLCADNFTVTITDGNGCTATGSILITEPQMLSFNGVPVSSTCGNPNGSACAYIIGGITPYSIQWDDPSNTSGPCVSNVFAGVYNPVVTDGNGCTYSTPVLVNDIAGPNIDSVAYTDVSCSGVNNGTASATVSSGTPPFTYIWQKGASTVSTGTLTVFNLSAGTYSFTVIDGNGCLSSLSFTINTPSSLASAIISKTDVECYGLCTGTMTVGVAGGSLPYTYLWSTSPVQNTPTATGLCAMTYNVIIYDSSGCMTTAQGTVTQPSTLSVIPITDSADCYGYNDGSISLFPTPTGGTPPYSYTWLPSGTGNGPVVTNLIAGNYAVIVTDGKGCTVAQNIPVGEPQPLFVNTTSNEERCDKNDGVVAAIVVGGTSPYDYFWIPGGNTSSIVTNLSSGTYIVIVSDYHGCSDQDTVVVNEIESPEINIVITKNVTCYGGGDGAAQVVFVSQSTPPYVYQWSSGGNQSSVSGLYAGSYTVNVTDSNGCADMDTFLITQPPALAVACSPFTLTVCYGDSTKIFATATGGVSPYTYAWSEPGMPGAGPHTVKPIANTIFVVTVTDANGCSAIGSSSIDVQQQLTVQAPDIQICAGDTAVLSATATGGTGTYDFYWSTGDQGAVVIIPGISTPATFYVTVSDNCSMDDTDTVTVSINELPAIQFTANFFEGCEPLVVQFFDNSTVAGSNITGWQWDFGDNNVSSQQNPSHLYSQAGTYDVSLTVTAASGCTDTYTWLNMISVYPIPDAFFIPKPKETTTIVPLIQFYDQSTGTIAGWLWDFGDPNSSAAANSSTLSNPAHEYSGTGTFIITLTVTSNKGCTDTYVDSVRIKSEYILFIPSAFTPNGDGDNEYFFPYVIGLNEDKFEFYIFDRWGDQIFYSDDIKKPWDGTANNGYNMAQQDVYIWVIRTEDLNGESHEYIGHVTLVK